MILRYNSFSLKNSIWALTIQSPLVGDLLSLGILLLWLGLYKMGTGGKNYYSQARAGGVSLESL